MSSSRKHDINGGVHIWIVLSRPPPSVGVPARLCFYRLFPYYALRRRGYVPSASTTRSMAMAREPLIRTTSPGKIVWPK